VPTRVLPLELVLLELPVLVPLVPVLEDVKAVETELVGRREELARRSS
jgi:hypothetical protein